MVWLRLLLSVLPEMEYALVCCYTLRVCMFYHEVDALGTNYNTTSDRGPFHIRLHSVPGNISGMRTVYLLSIIHSDT